MTLKNMQVSYLDLYLIATPCGIEEGGDLAPMDDKGFCENKTAILVVCMLFAVCHSPLLLSRAFRKQWKRRGKWNRKALTLLRRQPQASWRHLASTTWRRGKRWNLSSTRAQSALLGWATSASGSSGGSWKTAGSSRQCCRWKPTPFGWIKVERSCSNHPLGLIIFRHGPKFYLSTAIS